MPLPNKGCEAAPSRRCGPSARRSREGAQGPPGSAGVRQGSAGVWGVGVGAASPSKGLRELEVAGPRAARRQCSATRGAWGCSRSPPPWPSARRSTSTAARHRAMDPARRPWGPRSPPPWPNGRAPRSPSRRPRARDPSPGRAPTGAGPLSKRRPPLRPKGRRNPRLRGFGAGRSIDE